VVADRLVLDAEEVFLRAAGAAAVAQRLEVLSGRPATPVSSSAWQTRVLPLRGVAQTR
jgi:hypothetical protein